MLGNKIIRIMAVLSKGTKTDLCKLAVEWGLEVSTDDKVIEIGESI